MCCGIASKQGLRGIGRAACSSKQSGPTAAAALQTTHELRIVVHSGVPRVQFVTLACFRL